MKRSARPSGRLVAGCVLGGVLLLGALSAASILILSSSEPPREHPVTIPAGAAATVAGGKRPSLIPSEYRYRVGDTIVFVNEDAVSHTFGPWSIPAGETLRIVLDTATGTSFQCSFHEAGSVPVTIAEAADLRRAAIPALALGAPLGYALAWLVVFSRRLGQD